MPRTKIRAAPARLPNTRPAPPAFPDWCTREAFQVENSDKFPSVHSLIWQIRCHREKLVKAGAIADIAGRLHVHRRIFPETLIAIGKQRASRVA